jgi:membrane fusion protein, copper/silver efflux system
VLIIAVFAAVLLVVNNHYHFIKWGGEMKANAQQLYYCQMHPTIQSDKPGECPICYMSLVKRGTAESPAMRQTGEKKILYYRNPMNPAVTSPTPMKDEMGMDYVPVYAEETAQQNAGVYINPAKQQLIGVKTQKAGLRRLVGQIQTVGTVAYDPDLYVAQQEYLQAVKSPQQSDGIIKTAKQKLRLMGMSDTEITQLVSAGVPQQSLYLPENGKVWVYITIYEYEAGLMKEGLPLEVESPAYPAEVFKGSVVSVAPIVEAATRSLKVRALIDDPENKLKLRMYVNARVAYGLGEKLAVPQEAIMHAGMRDIVFVVEPNEPNGHFMPKTVTLGAKAQGYYEVLGGMKAGEEVVTSGNFLIDSESKLNAVLNQMTGVKDVNQ